MADMFTAKDMQNLLHVDRSTIYRMAEAGRLPAIKVGKQWRFPKEQVDDWFTTKTTVNTPSLSNPTTTNHIQRPDPDLAALLPVDCVQLIQDTFANLMRVMVVVTDMDGKPITQVSHPCGLFTAISQIPNAVQTCIEGWRELGTTIDLEPKFTPSHLELLCARAFIRVGPQLKGMVIVGGIAPKQWPPSATQIKAIANQFGVETETIAAHITEVFHLDDQAQCNLLSFVQRQADIIAHIVNERSKLGFE